MLKEKTELAQYLRSKCKSIIFNKEKLNTIVTEIEAENNVPTGITMDIISGRTKMEEDNEYLLFLILNKINPNKVSEYFTETEVGFYHMQQYKVEKLEFPIDIPCIQVSNDQWIGATDSNFLMRLRQAQLINYNTNAQRTMQRIVKGNREIYKIALNIKAVNEIRVSLESGGFVPNTITLNMPVDTDWSYDDKGILTIHKIEAFDISDGYHRYIAMCQAKEKNSDFNYPIELRIISFSDDKVRQFIYQEDQKTKMRRVDSASMNMNAPANVCLERLNTDTLFDLKEKIGRNGGSINFGEASSIIAALWFKGVKKASIPEILAVKDKVRDGINAFVEQNPDYFTKVFDFKELVMLLYGIYNNWEPQAIKEKIDKIPKLDKRLFSKKTVKKTLLNAIDKL